MVTVIVIFIATAVFVTFEDVTIGIKFNNMASEHDLNPPTLHDQRVTVTVTVTFSVTATTTTTAMFIGVGTQQKKTRAESPAY